MPARLRRRGTAAGGSSVEQLPEKSADACDCGASGAGDSLLGKRRIGEAPAGAHLHTAIVLP
jgi:hypothetical protein